MATRGQLDGLANLAPYLVSLGLAKVPDLHSKGGVHHEQFTDSYYSKVFYFLYPDLSFLTTESVALWAFQGATSPPPWVLLQASQGKDFLGVQERYLPLALEMYGCSQPGAPTRKDLELLKIATGLQ